MKIFHFIPKHEIGIHDIGRDCLCEPRVVEMSRLDGTSWLGEHCYEHEHFGLYKENGWNNFTAFEE